MDNPTHKEELRKALKSRRKALSPEEVKEGSEKIWEHLKANFSLSEYAIIHCFQSIEKFREVDTRPLFRWVTKALPGSKIAVPVMVPGTNALRHVAWSDAITMQPNKFGVPEPVTEKISVAPKDIDFVIVPLLGFDEKGNRIGYGKGYYDRFLGQLREDVPLVGVAFELSRVEEIPVEAHDIPLHWVITEEKVHKFVATNSENDRINSL